jgi:hypothetical protein
MEINESSIYQYLWSWTVNNGFSLEFGYLIDLLNLPHEPPLSLCILEYMIARKFRQQINSPENHILTTNKSAVRTCDRRKVHNIDKSWEIQNGGKYKKRYIKLRMFLPAIGDSTTCSIRRINTQLLMVR